MMCVYNFDIFVVRDDHLSFELLIGRNIIEHSDIQIITDDSGCRIMRKPGTSSHPDALCIQSQSDDVMAE